MKIWLGALVLVLATGCGGGATGPKVPSATGVDSEAAAATEDLRAAVQHYADAFLTADADASYALLSERCQARTSLATWRGLIEQMGVAYGSPLRLTSYTAKVSGDLARVTYTFSEAAINQSAEPWVRENGKWHEDDC